MMHRIVCRCCDEPIPGCFYVALKCPTSPDPSWPPEATIPCSIIDAIVNQQQGEPTAQTVYLMVGFSPDNACYSVQLPQIPVQEPTFTITPTSIIPDCVACQVAQTECPSFPFNECATSVALIVAGMTGTFSCLTIPGTQIPMIPNFQAALDRPPLNSQFTLDYSFVAGGGAGCSSVTSLCLGTIGPIASHDLWADATINCFEEGFWQMFLRVYAVAPFSPPGGTVLRSWSAFYRKTFGQFACDLYGAYQRTTPTQICGNFPNLQPNALPQTVQVL